MTQSDLSLPSRRELLMLTRVPGLGSRGISAILRHCRQTGRPLASVFGMSVDALREQMGIRADAAHCLATQRRELEVAADLLDCTLSEHGVRVLCFDDPDYPQGVSEQFQLPPPILFAYGNMAALEAPSVAVISSGQPSPWALQLTAAVAEAAATAGATIVTGHNRPAYQEAALAGKRAGTPVVAAVDRGVLRAFRGDLTREMFAAARIYGYEFPDERDLVISPFRPEDHWVGHHNRIRDAMVVALARLIVAIEVRRDGVMHAQCVRARQCGKRVMVCQPGEAWMEASGNQAMVATGFEAVQESILAQSVRSAVLRT